jgi:hypothetical protein
MMNNSRTNKLPVQKNRKSVWQPTPGSESSISRTFFPAAPANGLPQRIQTSLDSMTPPDIMALQRMVGNRQVQRLLARRTNSANGQQPHTSAEKNHRLKVQTKLTVSAPDDIYEQKADHVAGRVGRVPEPGSEEVPKTLHLQSSSGHVTPASPIQRKPKEDAARSSFPWIGRIDNTWSAALRKSPKKVTDNPNSNTLADLPRGTEITVVSRKGGWLHATVSVDGKALDGYVSQELVSYVKASAFDVGEIKVEVKVPSVAEAFVELKKAEKSKAKEGAAFKPSEEEQDRIDLAIGVINATKKYVVDQSTYVVSFAHKPGVKTEIESIEDFILFVEQVEKQHPTASPEQVVSEIRQLWFSDVNWELLVASEGISEAGKDVDIETEPNPIAAQFNMKTLAPAAGSKQFTTRMGKVDIGHVMAGIDARLSGFPAAYPKSHLAKRGHDNSDAKLKYETLKTASGGDSRDFATWAGDLGQAYAEYLVERYVKGNASALLSTFITNKAPPEEILGDIHGYIAVEVARDVPASASPTGGEHKVSNILRDMYLVDKSATGASYQKYVEKVSGKAGADLKTFITERSLRFAKPWYAKKAVEHRGWWGSEGWGKKGILENAMKEFDNKHAENEKTAKPDDKLDVLVDSLLKQLSAPVK